MSTTITKQAYELAQDTSHLNEISRNYDAHIVEWPEYRDYTTKFMDPDDFEFPTHDVEFQGYESCLSNTDFPLNNVSWPIMSKQMLDTLLSVREFPYRHWDVPFVGFPDNAPVAMLEEGLSGGVRHDNEFAAVQLLEQLDIFDWENSVYKIDPIFSNEVRSIRKLMLKVPEEGLPPVFRIKVYPVRLYVSPEGRSALEAANIKGVRFV
jgi:hypothetical protein